MSDPDPAVKSPAEAKPRRRGCFGLAFKSTLGCAAFLFGAIVVLILLLPTICEGPVRSSAQSIFDERFHGTLELGEIDLAWRGEQTVRDAALFDPEHREVARASAVLPSIFDLIGREGTLRVRIEVDADLSADDQGVTNLQRALEPREPAGEKKPDVKVDGPDALSEISRLDLEVEIVSKRLAWSDAETRRTGKPFEVRDFTATLRAKPGQPITAQAKGTVVSDAPGKLELEATVHGPLESGKAWPFGPVDADVRIEGFSTAMVDGVAGMGGKLAEVLGPRFDLRIALARMTPEQGDLEIELVSERTRFGFGGRFEGGFLRTRDDAPVRATVGVPRGFVAGLIAPALPPDVQLAWEEGEKPWTIQIANLALPIPDAGALDAKGIARSLERLTCDVEFDLPARITLTGPQVQAVGETVGIEQFFARAGISPGQPARVRLEANLLGSMEGRLVAQVDVRDPWKALADGSVPVVDATVDAGIPTAAIDTILGQKGPVLASFGPQLSLKVNAKDANPAGGSFELLAHAGARTAIPSAAEPRFELSFGARMEAGKLIGQAEVNCIPSPELFDRMVAPAMTSLGPVELVPAGGLRLQVQDITVLLADPLGSNLGFRLTGGVGPLQLAGMHAACELEAQLVEGSRITASVRALAGDCQISVSASTDEAQVLLAGPTKGMPAMRAEVLVEATGKRAVTALSGIEKSLPEGSHLEMPNKFRIALNEISLPATPAGAPLTSAFEGLGCKVEATVDSIAYADDQTRAAGVELSLHELELRATAAPGKPFTTSLSSGLSTGKGKDPGKIVASSSLIDPWFFLRGEEAKLPPVDAELRLIDLPTDLLDAQAGRAGLFSGLLGPKAQLTVAAKQASPEGGTFDVALTSPSASVAVAGRLEKGSFVSTNGPALAVAANLNQPWLDQQVAAFLPAGARLTVVDAQSPMRLTVSQLRLPLPQSPVGKEALAAASLHLEATLPALTYSEPPGAPAPAPRAQAGQPQAGQPQTPRAQTPPPATLRELKIQADYAPGTLPRASISAKVEGEPPGELTAAVRALDPLTILAEENGLDRFRVAIDANAKAMPTGLVDAMAKQDGLLVDVLGPRIELTLHTASISMSEGNLTAWLQSEQASVRIERAGLKDGFIVFEKPQGKAEALSARVGLTPLFSERIVGSLVPVLVKLEKPQGSDPIALAVEDLRFPMDADLSKLDGVVRIDLGEVLYRLLPGLEALQGDGKIVRIPEIRVLIEKGIAKYDSLPLKIAGRDITFRGTFDLAEKTFEMKSDVPLAVLGKKLNSKLDDLRGVLDPNTMVPLELSGTWKNPKVRLGDDFVKKLAEDALLKQGGNFLEGLLKKKKD